MPEVGFIHLHVHSAYSLLAGMMQIPSLVEAAKADEQPAIGIADNSNLFGALEFSSKAFAAGIQPILGCDLPVSFGDQHKSSLVRHKSTTSPQQDQLVLIAATEEGWHNLMELVSNFYLSGSEQVGVSLSELSRMSLGVIALTGGTNGPIDQCLIKGQVELGRERLQDLARIFGDRLYVEVQRYVSDDTRENLLLELSQSLDLSIVATNEPYFLRRDDYEACTILSAIREGRTVTEEYDRRVTPEHYFKSRTAMMELFSDLPEALESTIEIAQRCSYRPLPRDPVIPKFISTPSGESEDFRGGNVEKLDAEALEKGSFSAAPPGPRQVVDRSQNLRTDEELEVATLMNKAVKGLQRRLEMEGCAPGTTREDYKNRLAFELSVIEKMKFVGYFLIVADFIQWAKTQGIPVGPGRGSGAGSLTAWALTITDIDPLRFGLLFERFLNPERVSMPDFDIDFCQDRRDEVIEYVQDKYGHDRVAHIITFGTLQSKAVLRDVSRVLEIPYRQADNLIKLIPNALPSSMSLHQIIEEEPKIQEARMMHPIIDRLLNIAVPLEGLYRHASTHAAGIVIGDRPLKKLLPLYCDPCSRAQLTQYNMKWVEEAGLIKFDLLGLKTLTVLSTSLSLLHKRGIEIDLSHLSLDDEATYDLLRQGTTSGVFQLESQGMRKAINDVKPDSFNDIIALISLYRPGPMANIVVYGARKHGLEKPSYPHTLLEPVLKETYGIILYQEQVMEISRILAGYSASEADLLRRAMGKKNQEEMDLQRLRFVDGAVANGVDKDKSEEVYELLAKFAGYGFNKSHAAAYALIAYQTAYMKAHFPVEFIAAVMTSDISNTDKLDDLRREAKRLGVVIELPSINESGSTFEVDRGRIIYALSAIKGVGKQAVDHIIEARGDVPFRDLTDFANRVDLGVVNKRTLEKLIAAGTFDCLEINRARVMTGVDAMISASKRRREEDSSGQQALFSDGREQDLSLLAVEPWTRLESLQNEYQSVGFYLSEHPLDVYLPFLDKLRIKLCKDIVTSENQGSSFARLFGVVVSRQRRKTKNGRQIGIICLDDPSGRYEVTLFAEKLALYWDMVSPGHQLVVHAHTQEGWDTRGGLSLRAEEIEELSAIAKRHMSSVRISVSDSEAIISLKKILSSNQDEEGVSVILHLALYDKEADVRLPGKWNISPGLLSELQRIPGIDSIQSV